MAKQNGGKPQIDEDFMKEIISQGLPVKKQETPMVAIPTEVKTKAETPDIPANVPEQEPKRELLRPIPPEILIWYPIIYSLFVLGAIICCMWVRQRAWLSWI